MIAEFSVYMPGEKHMSPHIANVTSLLDKANLEYKVGATSTSLRGDSNKIFSVLEHCYDLLKHESEELVMNINLVQRKEEHHNLNESIESVYSKRKAI